MAGNPFRRPGGGSVRSADAEAPRVDTTTKSRVKKVQFVSPIASPEETLQQPWPGPGLFDNTTFNELEQPRSPPPQGLAHEGLDTGALLRGDPTGGGAVDLEENARRQHVSPFTPRTPSTGIESRPGGPIGNPFARTLATLEPEGSETGKKDERQRISFNTNQSDAAASRGTMDVDAFKRMLLTGHSGIEINTDGASKAPPDATNVASSTRTTVFEPLQEPHPQSPASSPDLANSDEDIGPPQVTANTQPVAEAVEEGPSVKPFTLQPAPRSQSPGKPLPSSGPQTVSFADFDAAFASHSSSKTSLPRYVVEDRPGLTRSPSDLNKPLPAPPNFSHVGLEVSDRQPDADRSAFRPTQITTQSKESEDPKKKAPPPPPPSARRHVQPKVASGNGSNSALDQVDSSRVRSGSNISQSSTVSEALSAKSDARSDKPLPPPHRLPTVASGDSTTEPSLASTPESEASSIVPQEASGPREHAVQKMRPPPPPSRNFAKPSSGLARSPSVQSTASATARRVTSAPTGSAPPPPPPPRRREAKGDSKEGMPVSSGARRDSNDSRRFSGQEIGSERRDSMSSNRRDVNIDSFMATKELPTSRFSNSTLDDLDAFQREVDALRAKTLNGK